jgi:glycerol uptake facilitator-like aquaporin
VPANLDFFQPEIPTFSTESAVLCRSSLRRVLVKSNANGWSSPCNYAEFSHHVRTGPSQWFSEYLATSGLVLTILLCDKYHKAKVPQVVAAYVVAAYWFTSSTSFANPAVTIARGFTDTFSGIRISDVAPFIIAQFFGGLTALFLAKVLGGKEVVVDIPQPGLHEQKLPIQ